MVTGLVVTGIVEKINHRSAEDFFGDDENRRNFWICDRSNRFWIWRKAPHVLAEPKFRNTFHRPRQTVAGGFVCSDH
jgi:hypothetical protein